jgi:hypothetical protein
MMRKVLSIAVIATIALALEGCPNGPTNQVNNEVTANEPTNDNLVTGNSENAAQTNGTENNGMTPQGSTDH